MQAVSSWIVSIAGVIALSVLIELIMPDGQMNKYIKSIFSFIIVFVIISPIPKLLKQEITFSEFFDSENSFSIDENYLEQVNLNKLTSSQEAIEHQCLEKGYKNIKVYINADIFSGEMNIKSVYVDLSELVLLASAEHTNITNIKKHISQIIQSNITISEEFISYET